MVKWEYRLLWIDIHMSPVLRLARWGVDVPGEKKPRTTREGVEAYINDVGAEGWDLVSVINGTDHNGTITRAVLFFKRPLADAPVATPESGQGLPAAPKEPEGEVQLG